jgi:hypothetical protein
MGRQQSQNTPFKLGDYNEPTEPVERIILPPYANPTYGATGLSPDALTVPAPQPDERPVPQGGRPAYPYPSHQEPAVYPVLPEAPLKRYRGIPPGGAARYAQPVRRRRRSMIPGLVGFFLLLVQLALLVRAVCILFGVQNTTSWLTLLFAASDLFLQPVRLLAANVNLSFLAGVPQLLTILELLVAVLAYGILSRLLVRLLRVLFNS